MASSDESMIALSNCAARSPSLTSSMGNLALPALMPYLNHSAQSRKSDCLIIFSKHQPIVDTLEPWERVQCTGSAEPAELLPDINHLHRNRRRNHGGTERLPLLVALKPFRF